MLKVLRQQAFASIIEVIVTAVIFLIAAVGIMTTLSMLRPHGMESYKKLEAVYIAKNFIDTLRGEVQANSWIDNTGNLATGVLHSEVVGGYTINWILVEPPGFPAGMAPRQMFMNIQYPD